MNGSKPNLTNRTVRANFVITSNNVITARAPNIRLPERNPESTEEAIPINQMGVSIKNGRSLSVLKYARSRGILIIHAPDSRRDGLKIFLLIFAQNDLAGWPVSPKINADRWLIVRESEDRGICDKLRKLPIRLIRPNSSKLIVLPK